MGREGMVSTDAPGVEARLRPLRLVVGAMAVGLVVMAVAFWFFHRQGTPEPRDELTDRLLPILILVAAGAYFCYRIWRGLELRRLQAGAPHDEQRLLQAFLMLRILAAALVEAVGIFAAVIYFLGGAPVSLVAMALSIGTLVRMIPVAEQFQSFVAESRGPSPIS